VAKRGLNVVRKSDGMNRPQERKKETEIRKRRKRMTQLNNRNILISVYMNQNSRPLYVLAVPLPPGLFSVEKAPFCASGRRFLKR
jgi:hypothetical protein